MRRDIEFDAKGTILRGWFYTPEDRSDPQPAIVMASGFASVKERFLDLYAQVFVEAGFVVLVYDHRNFGASDGLPRQEVDPWAQARDYRHAITFLQTRPEVDPQRIGIWGSSNSGGHVLVVGAIDRRVRCVVSQIPTISGYQAALRRVPADRLPALLAKFDADRTARFCGAPPTMVPIVTVDANEVAAYVNPDAFESLRPASESKIWRNEITLRSIEMAREYEPGVYVSRISPTPLLLVVATADTITPPDLQIEAFERALQPKRLLLCDGGHHSVYGEKFSEVSTAARDFFLEHL